MERYKARTRNRPGSLTERRVTGVYGLLVLGLFWNVSNLLVESRQLLYESGPARAFARPPQGSARGRWTEIDSYARPRCSTLVRPINDSPRGRNMPHTRIGSELVSHSCRPPCQIQASRYWTWHPTYPRHHHADTLDNGRKP